MDISNFQRSGTALTRPEAEPERLARIQRETVLVAQAEADIDAGHGIDEAGLTEWLDALDRDENTPLPVRRNNGPAPS